MVEQGTVERASHIGQLVLQLVLGLLLANLMDIINVSCATLFLFFQAEDGIRDVAVTGVQTCALPIYERVEATLIPTFLGAHLDLGGDYIEQLIEEMLPACVPLSRGCDVFCDEGILTQIGRASCRERV